MMSLGVAWSIPERLSGVMMLSGRLVPDFLVGEAPTKFGELPFLVQHGILDNVLPVAGAREAETYLEGKGCPLTYFEYSMGHEISRESLSDARDWIEDLIG